MKKIMFCAAICIVSFTSNAQANLSGVNEEVKLTTLEEVVRNPDLSLNGIELNYSTVDVAGNVLLNLSFTNTSEETITFTWELSKGLNISRSTELVTLKPGKSFSQNAVMEVKGAFNPSEYSIKLIKK